MDTLALLCKNMDEMKQMFANKMSSFEESLGNRGQAQDSVLWSEYQTFKTFIWKAVSSLNKQMELVFFTLDENEMRSRANILLLHGLSESSEEDIVANVQKICQDKVKVALPTGSITACWRMGKTIREDKPRPVFIRFSDTHIRSEIWAAKKHLKGSGLTLSEFLTASRHAVFVEARKALGVKGCWTSDGKIVVVTAKGLRKKITTMTELRAITNEIGAVKPKGDQLASGSNTVFVASPVSKELASCGPSDRPQLKETRTRNAKTQAKSLKK